MIFALSVVVPAAFAWGLATRREDPVPATPGPHLSGGSLNQVQLWSRDDLWESKAVRTRLLRDGADTGRFAVELIAKDEIAGPDLLVYLVPGERTLQDPLPDNAFLLGSFDPSTPAALALPVEAAQQPAVLVLYSLANQEVVAVSRPFSVK